MNIIRNSATLVARHRPLLQQSIRHGGTIPVILKDGLQNKGETGDVVQVKRGFARNFLIPRKLAGKFYFKMSFYYRLLLDFPMGEREGIPT